MLEIRLKSFGENIPKVGSFNIVLHFHPSIFVFLCNSEVRIYDTKTRKVEHVFKHKYSINDMIKWNDRIFVTGCYDNNIRFFSAFHPYNCICTHEFRYSVYRLLKLEDENEYTVIFGSDIAVSKYPEKSSREFDLRGRITGFRTSLLKSKKLKNIFYVFSGMDTVLTFDSTKVDRIESEIQVKPRNAINLSKWPCMDILLNKDDEILLISHEGEIEAYSTASKTFLFSVQVDRSFVAPQPQIHQFSRTGISFFVEKNKFLVFGCMSSGGYGVYEIVMENEGKRWGTEEKAMYTWKRKNKEGTEINVGIRQVFRTGQEDVEVDERLIQRWGASDPLKIAICSADYEVSQFEVFGLGDYFHILSVKDLEERLEYVLNPENDDLQIVTFSLHLENLSLENIPFLFFLLG